MHPLFASGGCGIKQTEMSKEKFIYNKQTLQYERIEVSGKEVGLKIFGFISAAVMTAVLTFPLWKQLIPVDARLQQKNQEIEQYALKLNAMQKHVETMDKALSSLHNRSNGVYRKMFNMNPMDESRWLAGTGGHDKYADFAKFASTESIIDMQDRVELLSRQIGLHSRSLDTIAGLVNEKEKMLSSIPSIKPVREDKLHESISVLSGFGYRIHPIYKVKRFHAGIDFSADQGVAIQATGDGVIVRAGKDGGYGNVVVIKHGYGYETLYGHMSKIEVQEGQHVKRGQRIGLIGSTGHSTGPHCHYEVHVNGTVVNPLDFVHDGLTPSEYAALVQAAMSENNSFD
jgi:murein DD-endopeptidase MepM/ murein hydrolase activator NlpD